MIDRLVTDIESEVEGETPVSGGSGEDSPTLSESYTVDIFRDGNVIETFEDSVQSDLIASVVGYLVESHDLINDIRPLPYIPGQERAIVNDEPTYNDRKMKQPRELEQGYYLEVNLSWDQKQREMERLAEACGLEVTIGE
jgi:hypothetical protein